MTSQPFAYVSSETSWDFLSDIMAPSLDYKLVTTLRNSMNSTSSLHPYLSNYVLGPQVAWKNIAWWGGANSFLRIGSAYSEKGICAFIMFIEALTVNV